MNERTYVSVTLALDEAEHETIAAVATVYELSFSEAVQLLVGYGLLSYAWPRVDVDLKVIGANLVESAYQLGEPRRAWPKGA